MKSSKVFIILIMLISPLLFSFTITNCSSFRYIQGEGDVITKELTLKEFNKINISCPCDVKVTYGNTQEVMISGHLNIINMMKIYVANKTLNVDLKNGNYRNLKLSMKIIIPNLVGAKSSGSGDIVIKDFSNQESINTSSSGSGDLELNNLKDIRNLKIRTSGSGDIYLNKISSTENANITTGGSGDILINDIQNLINMKISVSGSGDIKSSENISQLTNLELRISGSGDYSGYNIVCENCTIMTSGSSDCKVYATKNLRIRTSGSGDVSYKGQPHIDFSASGSGHISQAD